jgi:hypothetical protein
MPQENEVDKLFSDLPSQDKQEADIFSEKPNIEADIPEKDTEEEGKKNRRHRRLEEQLTRERESNIALSERIKALSEAQEFTREFIKKDRDEDLDPDLIRVFGESPEGREVARIMEKKMESVISKAEENALRKFQEKLYEEDNEVKQYESLIDSEIESIEDEYNIDLSSGAPTAKKARKEFLDMIVKLSPKDEEGNITNYADFQSTFEVYQSTIQKPDASRNKELASRSMQKSGQSDTSALEDDATRRYLKSIGIRI